MDTKKLTEIRVRMGFTQEQMADWLQCDYVGLKRYEGGSRPIPRYIARSVVHLEFLHENKLLKKFERFLKDA